MLPEILKSTSIQEVWYHKFFLYTLLVKISKSYMQGCAHFVFGSQKVVKKKTSPFVLDIFIATIKNNTVGIQ